MSRKILTHFFNKVQLSHILCIAFGALVPIYSDMLFLHSYDSSTTSAIMDTIVALSALYAAFSVRNWLKDRVKNKGFEHAENLLAKLNQSHVLLFAFVEKWKVFCLEFTCGSSTSVEEEKLMKVQTVKFLEESASLNIKISELLADLKTLKSWDMICTKERDYEKYIFSCENTRQLIDNFINSVDSEYFMVRHHKWLNKKNEIEESYANTANMHNNLEIRFQDVFVYSPPSKKID
ncbi:hypothetical protein [Enterobacter asburiae]|uniref:hypothetical protein n=1 Tax=Enterobacter asburiae TaxID=61645 RepID=UPI0020030912|nr:hypothetical protein [Enterobacter asburiae]MCK6655563.1 hypothetical protein [Enterobacter asburiae]